jgi:predicted N-acyltransferase
MMLKPRWKGFAVAAIIISFLSALSTSYPLQLSTSPRKNSRISDTESNISLRAVKKQSNGEVSLKEDIQFDLHSSILKIAAHDWDSCLANDESASPFMKHSWLRCLEESDCVCKETGWIPQHVSIKIDGSVCGFVPLYIKSHSMGEFVFDNGWADAAEANGIDYYPKLLVAVPFTPVSSQRILLHPRIANKYPRKKIAALRKMLAIFLKQVARNNKLSSVHINFLTEEEATDIAGGPRQPSTGDAYDESLQKKVKSILKKLKYVDADDYLRRTSLQYHWSNSNSKNEGKQYSSFDEYLSCFKSKRRIAIRRERSKVQEDEDIRIDTVVGRDILKYDGLVERMFQIYLSTVNKIFFGRQYLSMEFFNLLAKSDFIDNLCFMCARRKSSGETLKAADVIAGTFNIVQNDIFYGRYWGCLEEVKNLHFETCYWAAIEYCIDNGLRRMEPGAGGGGKCYNRIIDPAL